MTSTANRAPVSWGTVPARCPQGDDDVSIPCRRRQPHNSLVPGYLEHSAYTGHDGKKAGQGTAQRGLRMRLGDPKLQRYRGIAPAIKSREQGHGAVRRGGWACWVSSTGGRRVSTYLHRRCARGSHQAYSTSDSRRRHSGHAGPEKPLVVCHRVPRPSAPWEEVRRLQPRMHAGARRSKCVTSRGTPSRTYVSFVLSGYRRALSCGRRG